MYFSFVLEDEQKWIGEAVLGSDTTDYREIFYYCLSPTDLQGLTPQLCEHQYIKIYKATDNTKRLMVGNSQQKTPFIAIYHPRNRG